MAKLIRYGSVRVIVLLICCTLSDAVFGQENFFLQVQYADSVSTRLRQNAGIQTIFKYKAECDEYLVKLPSILQSKGFISASVDSFFYNLRLTLMRKR